MAESSSSEGALIVTSSKSTKLMKTVLRVIRGYMYEVCLRLITPSTGSDSELLVRVR